nr:MAG TPA: hypothetical protein [Bacteriophage sp.]
MVYLGCMTCMLCDICDYHQSGVLYTSDSNLFHRTLSEVYVHSSR